MTIRKTFEINQPKTLGNLFPKFQAGKSLNVISLCHMYLNFRDRDQQLRMLLHHLHPILKRQNIIYCIYVIEQSGNAPFNRAMMLNIGFTMAMNLTSQDYWDCFIFHDVDMFLENDYNLYQCPRQPRHLAVGTYALYNFLPKY